MSSALIAAVIRLEFLLGQFEMHSTRLPPSMLLLCVLSVFHMAVVKLDLFRAVTHEHFMVRLVPIQDAAHRTWTLLR